MFQLAGNRFPNTKEELIAALTDGYRVFGSVRGIAELSGDYPAVDQFRVDLSGGHISPGVGPSSGVGESVPGFTARRFEAVADPLFYEQSPVQVRVWADETRFGFDRNEEGLPVIELMSAARGNLQVSMSHVDLERLVQALIDGAAQSKGVSVPRVALSLHAEAQRRLSFEISATVQKAIFSAELVLSGKAEIDGHLDAMLAGLTCSGSGPVGSVASEMLRPLLEKLEGRKFSLAGFSLGGIQVSDVRVQTGSAVRIEADFRA